MQGFEKTTKTFLHVLLQDFEVKLPYNDHINVMILFILVYNGSNPKPLCIYVKPLNMLRYQAQLELVS